LLKPAIQLQLKTLWNAIQPLAGFIYQEVELRRHQGQPQAIDIRLRPHQGRRQTSGDADDDGILGSLGTAVELEGNGAGIPNQSTRAGGPRNVMNFSPIALLLRTLPKMPLPNASQASTGK